MPTYRADRPAEDSDDCIRATKRICSRCRRKLPALPGYFHRDGFGRLRPSCVDCELARRRQQAHDKARRERTARLKRFGDACRLAWTSAAVTEAILHFCAETYGTKTPPSGLRRLGDDMAALVSDPKVSEIERLRALRTILHASAVTDGERLERAAREQRASSDTDAMLERLGESGELGPAIRRLAAAGRLDLDDVLYAIDSPADA